MSEVVNVFWTGGWDSTYRVLDLVLVQGATAQPHYIIEPERRSALHELRVMRSIRESIKKDNEEAYQRLLPTQLTEVGDIRPNVAITKMYDDVIERHRTARQYEWLKRYAVERGIEGVEVGFQGDGNVWFSPLLRELSVPITAANGSPSWVLPKDHGNRDLRILDSFTYPTLFIKKNEMRQRAREHGFLELLERSWFCPTPIGRAPCGACYVCRQAMASGMADRFTTMGHVRHRIWMVVQPIRALISSPELFSRRVVERWKLRDFK